MKRKKILSVLLAMGLTLSALTGCGGGNSQEAAAPADREAAAEQPSAEAQATDAAAGE